MVNRNLIIAIVILVIVILGFMFISSMTGNVITGSVANDEVVVNELFRIDEINENDEVLNGSQNSGGSG